MPSLSQEQALTLKIPATRRAGARVPPETSRHLPPQPPALSCLQHQEYRALLSSVPFRNPPSAPHTTSLRLGTEEEGWVSQPG